MTNDKDSKLNQSRKGYQSSMKEPIKNISVKTPYTLYEKIQEFKRFNKIRNNSEALRLLIISGLSQGIKLSKWNRVEKNLLVQQTRKQTAKEILENLEKFDFRDEKYDDYGLTRDSYSPSGWSDYHIKDVDTLKHDLLDQLKKKYLGGNE